MTEREREIFETAAGFLRELSPVCLINLSYNLDCYSFYPGVFTVGSHTFRRMFDILFLKFIGKLCLYNCSIVTMPLFILEINFVW